MCNLKISEQINKLIKPGKIYGIGCESRIEETRLSPTVRPENAGKKVLFLVCPEKVLFDKAFTDLNDQVQKSNALGNEQYYVSQSSLEKDGLQARFSIFTPDTTEERNNLDIDKLEFIVWSLPESEEVKILILSEIPYNAKDPVVKTVKSHQAKIIKSLPNLQTILLLKWKMGRGPEFDHYLGRNDAMALDFNYDYYLTHSVPRLINRSKDMDFSNNASQNFATTISKDTVDEVIESPDPKNPKNTFTKYLQKN